MSTEASIFQEAIDASAGEVSPALARFLLSLDFTDGQHARMAELSERASQGDLDDAGRDELERFLNVGDLMAVLQSRARRALTTAAKH